MLHRDSLLPGYVSACTTMVLSSLQSVHSKKSSPSIGEQAFLRVNRLSKTNARMRIRNKLSESCDVGGTEMNPNPTFRLVFYKYVIMFQSSCQIDSKNR